MHQHTTQGVQNRWVEWRMRPSKAGQDKSVHNWEIPLVVVNFVTLIVPLFMYIGLGLIRDRFHALRLRLRDGKNPSEGPYSKLTAN